MSDDSGRKTPVKSTHSHSHGHSSSDGCCITRRGLLGAGALGVAGALLPSPLVTSAAADRDDDDDRRGRGRRGRLLLKGGIVLTMLPGAAPLPDTDVLVVNGKIREVRPNIHAHDAEVIDCRGKIVMPGFVDTHRHMWQGLLRNIGPDDLLGDYLETILGSDGSGFALSLTPEEVYLGDLVTALSALNSGITTILDWSHINGAPNSPPRHVDAVIQALRDAGIRAVYAYGPNFYKAPFWYPPEAVNPYPEYIKVLRGQYFNSSDQLLTLALAAAGPQFSGSAEAAAYEWKTAREVGARISVHVGVGAFGAGGVQALRTALLGIGQDLGPDTTYIHACTLTPAEFDLIAHSGGTASIATPVEMQMGHGTPPIRQCLDHGVPISLSVDVETNQPTDMFTQMHACFALQREIENQGHLFPDESHRARLLTVRQVLEFATVGGAKANGLDGKIGTLATGKEADILLLNARAINVAPINDPIGAIVLGMDSSNVDSVFVAGKAVKRKGRLVGVDVEHVLSQAEQAQEAVLARVA